MSENPSLAFSTSVATKELERSPSTLARREWLTVLEVMTGYGLIMGTIWTVKTTQRWFFWIAAAWFLGWAVFATRKALRRGFKLPPAKVTMLVIFGGALVAGSVVALAAAMGTLHGLFNRKDPVLHAGSYLVWAVVQQIIQQTYFLARFEQLTQSGLRASLIAAALFAVAHLPNPVLTPVTLFGGWLMSELYLRYRTVLSLGIAHGLVGMAIAVSIPDHLQHHMRVGLSYLVYPH
jgi:membrane protease YdiL (CAAX protease family)